MKWYHYIATFFAGVFLVNALPHFFHGISGARFDLPGGTVNNLPFLYANENLDRDMNQSGINHVFNDGHSWANWRERTDEILVYFFGTEKL